MDLQRLSKPAYTPDKTIEGWTTLIWTERYLEPGEFKVVTPYVNEHRTLLPEMALVTLRDTAEVMMVENQEIQNNSDGIPELTITGRSIDAFAEERWLEAPYGKRYPMAAPYSATEAALVLLWNAFVNPTENDVTHAIDWFRFSTDSLPNVVVSNSSTTSPPSGRRYLDGGSMERHLKKFLYWRRLGVRGVRPIENSDPTKVVHVGNNFPGSVSYTTMRTDSLRFDVYNGSDRAIGNLAGREPVIFSASKNDFDNPKYLFSVKDRKTVATIVSGGYNNGGIKVHDETLPGDQGSSSTGWARRGLWLDGGSIEDGGNWTEWVEDLVDMAKDALDEHKLTRVFDGQIENLSEYTYKEHYSIGDKITMLGDYGITQTMRVSEYVRTEDHEGERGYPGLASDD